MAIGESLISMIDVGQKVISYLHADPAAKKAFEVLSPYGDIFAVGGAPRDVILGKKPKDIDLMARIPAETVEKVLKSVPDGKLAFAGKNFGVFHFYYKGNQVEIALPRVEQSTGVGHKDFDVQADHRIPVETDLGRRDFTGNAIAVNLRTGEVIDPLQGASHLSSGLLQHTNPRSFHDDPLRALRGLTMRARHNLNPSEETAEAMRAIGPLLGTIPGDRIRDEMNKILKSDDPEGAIRLAQQLGLLEHFLPEVSSTFGFDQKNPYHNLDLGEHLLQVFKNVSALTSDPDVRMAGLLHDIGKPESFWQDEKGIGHYYQGKNGQGADHALVGAQKAEDIMRRWNYPSQNIGNVTGLIQHHMFPEFNGPNGARRFINRVGGPETAQNLLDLRQADHMGKGNDHATAQMVNKMRDLVEDEGERAPLGVRDLAISGQDIMNIKGIPPGKAVGDEMRRLLELVLEDPALNTREALTSIVKNSKNLVKNATNTNAFAPKGLFKSRRNDLDWLKTPEKGSKWAILGGNKWKIW